MSRLMSAIGVLLIGRQLPLERVLELLLPVRVGAEGVARHRLARGVELEQLLGHVAHRLLDARLGLLPGRAAELVERRPRRAGVLLDEIEPLDRDEELVLAGVAELHELLRLEADLDPLQADEHADAVVDVDDEVADLEIAEVGEERARSPSGGARAPAALPRRRRSRPRAAARRPAAGSRATDGRSPTSTAGRCAHPRRARSAPRRLVVGEQLDGPLGAARRCRRRRRPCRRARGRGGSRPTQSWMRPSNSSAGWQAHVADLRSVVVADRERLERGRAVEPPAPRRPSRRPAPRGGAARLALARPLRRSWRRSAASASRRARGPRPAPRRGPAGAGRCHEVVEDRCRSIRPVVCRRRRRSAPAAERSPPDRARRSTAASPGRRGGSTRWCRRRTRGGSAGAAPAG